MQSTTITEISNQELLLSLLIMGVPILFFLYYKVPIIKSTLIGVVRMVVQLAFVAVYLEWVFEMNNAWINMGWVLIMILVGVMTTMRKVSLNWRPFIIPLLIAGLSSVIIVDAFFLGLIIKLEYLFEARYMIPITGMILGNALNYNIVGLSTYMKDLREKSNLYYFLLTNTGDMRLALRPFIKEALMKAMNPMIANMSVIGLISLPGMMTGQILGGSSPATAIRYQIMIMLAIFVGCSMNLLFSIILSNRFMFDGYQNLKSHYFTFE